MHTSVFNILGRHVLVITIPICLLISEDYEVNTLVLNFMQNLHEMQWLNFWKCQKCHYLYICSALPKTVNVSGMRVNLPELTKAQFSLSSSDQWTLHGKGLLYLMLNFLLLRQKLQWNSKMYFFFHLFNCNRQKVNQPE